MSDSPFSYSIRVSARARYLRLRVTIDKGLEVVVPRGYDQGRIPELLTTNHRWVQTALQRVEDVRRQQPLQASCAIPNQISFPSIGRVWYVEAISSRSRSVTVEEPAPDRLVVRGRIDDHWSCARCGTAALGDAAGSRRLDSLAGRSQSGNRHPVYEDGDPKAEKPLGKLLADWHDQPERETAVHRCGSGAVYLDSRTVPHPRTESFATILEIGLHVLSVIQTGAPPADGRLAQHAALGWLNDRARFCSKDQVMFAREWHCFSDDYEVAHPITIEIAHGHLARRSWHDAAHRKFGTRNVARL